jgi:hypothetical protein
MPGGLYTWTRFCKCVSPGDHPTSLLGVCACLPARPLARLPVCVQVVEEKPVLVCEVEYLRDEEDESGTTGEVRRITLACPLYVMEDLLLPSWCGRPAVLPPLPQPQLLPQLLAAAATTAVLTPNSS